MIYLVQCINGHSYNQDDRKRKAHSTPPTKCRLCDSQMIRVWTLDYDSLSAALRAGEEIHFKKETKGKDDDAIRNPS